MGLLDRLLKKPEKTEETKQEQSNTNQIEIDPKYANVICSACNQPGANKKFGGQHWHKQCLRKMRKMAKGMF